MVRVVVINPTRLWGGLDVLLASVNRQTLQPVAVIVGDEKYEERKFAWQKFYVQLANSDTELEAFKPEWREGTYRNLAYTYNQMLDRAVKYEPDLIISLQDYFWAPPDGFERFAKVMEQFPKSVYTGTASLSADPPKETVVDFEGHYTIFAEPYEDKPQEIGWRDPRPDVLRGVGVTDEVVPVHPRWWELNWASISGEIARTLRFDETYDQGCGYENQDYAARAMLEFGAQVIIDTGNNSIGLDHKSFYREIETEEMDHNNMDLHMSRYGW